MNALIPSFCRVTDCTGGGSDGAAGTGRESSSSALPEFSQHQPSKWRGLVHSSLDMGCSFSVMFLQESWLQWWGSRVFNATLTVYIWKWYCGKRLERNFFFVYACMTFCLLQLWAGWNGTHAQRTLLNFFVLGALRFSFCRCFCYDSGNWALSWRSSLVGPVGNWDRTERQGRCFTLYTIEAPELLRLKPDTLQMVVVDLRSYIQLLKEPFTVIGALH